MTVELQARTVRNSDVTSSEQVLPPVVEQMIAAARTALEKVMRFDYDFTARARAIYRANFDLAAEKPADVYRFGMLLDSVISGFADELAQSGKSAEAELLRSHQISRQPECYGGLAALARHYVDVRRYEKAESVLDIALQSGKISQKICEVSGWLYERTQDPQAAAPFWQLAFPAGIVRHDHYTGAGTAPRVLALMSLLPGCLYFEKFLGADTCDLTTLTMEAYRPEHAVPDHDVLLVALSDADLCGYALERARAIVARSKAPVINAPDRVLATTRANVSKVLAQIPAVRTPRTVELDRALLEAEDGLAAVRSRGFDFPFLLRSPGYQNGEHFELIRTPAEFTNAVWQLPGRTIFVIEYIATARADGSVRKYRVCSIDGRLYPIHLAIARSWKIHYDSSAMPDVAAFRREEEAFLARMDNVLGDENIRALHHVFAALGLEYAGADFTLDAQGRLVIFEANATMALWPPAPGATWDYRRAAVARAVDAARAMVISRGQSAAR